MAPTDAFRHASLARIGERIRLPRASVASAEHPFDLVAMCIAAVATPAALALPIGLRVLGIEPFLSLPLAVAVYGGVFVVGVLALGLVGRRQSWTVQRTALHWYAPVLLAATTISVLVTGRWSEALPAAVVFFGLSALLGGLDVLIGACLLAMVVYGGATGSGTVPDRTILVHLVLLVIVGVVARTVRSILLRSLESEMKLRVQAQAQAAELADLAARRQAAVEQLQHLDELRADFLATVSHELRTPVTVVRGGLETLDLEWDRLSEEQRRLLVAAGHRAARDLDAVLVALLEFRQLTGRSDPLALESLDPLALARAAIRRHHPANDRQVALRSEGGPPPQLIGDGGLLGRVLDEVLENTVQHAGPDASVEVVVRVVDEHVELAVRDDGRGIDDAALERALEPFGRGGDHLRRETRGLGVGLALCHQILRQHGADLHVARNPEGGTEVSFRLPSVAALPVAEGAAPAVGEGQRMPPSVIRA